MKKIKKIEFSHRFIILSSIITVLLLLGLFILRSAKRANPLTITLDKNEYSVNDNLKVTFKNISSKNICFSSNYHYLLEKPEKDGLTHQYAWKPILYSKSIQKDIADDCISPSRAKTFSVSLVDVGKGNCRLSVPICFSCQKGESFHKNRELYSPEFNIK